MSKLRVQCKGSGQPANAGVNAKRALCRFCARQQDVASNGNIRKHLRLTTTAQLRRSR